MKFFLALQGCPPLTFCGSSFNIGHSLRDYPSIKPSTLLAGLNGLGPGQ